MSTFLHFLTSQNTCYKSVYKHLPLPSFTISRCRLLCGWGYVRPEATVCVKPLDKSLLFLLSPFEGFLSSESQFLQTSLCLYDHATHLGVARHSLQNACMPFAFLTMFTLRTLSPSASIAAMIYSASTNYWDYSIQYIVFSLDYFCFGEVLLLDIF